MVQGEGQGQGLCGRGQGRGLVNWSSRTRTFFDDNNTDTFFYISLTVKSESV